MDIYAHNPFTFQEPSLSLAASPMGEVQFSDLPFLAGWIDRYLRKGMPILLSEFTIPIAVAREFDFYVEPRSKRNGLANALRLSRRWKRIYELGWIHVYRVPPVSSGGLLTSAGVPKPGFHAFEHG